MKTLSLIIGLFLLSIGSFGQTFFQVKTDSLSFENAKQLKILQREVKNIKYCSGEYRNQMLNSYRMGFLGSVIMASPLVIQNQKQETKNIVFAVGGAFELIALINTIDALKWFKRISINENGVGVKLKF